MSRGATPPAPAPDDLASARRVLDIEARALAAMSVRLGGEFAEAVGILSRCEGKVVVCGIGKSGLICLFFISFGNFSSCFFISFGNFSSCPYTMNDISPSGTMPGVVEQLQPKSASSKSEPICGLNDQVFRPQP